MQAQSNQGHPTEGLTLLADVLTIACPCNGLTTSTAVLDATFFQPIAPPPPPQPGRACRRSLDQ